MVLKDDNFFEKLILVALALHYIFILINLFLLQEQAGRDLRRSGQPVGMFRLCILGLRLTDCKNCIINSLCKIWWQLNCNWSNCFTTHSKIRRDFATLYAVLFCSIIQSVQ